MKYVTFATLLALQAFIATYDQRIVDTLHITPSPGWHYTAPMTLIATAPFFAAPMPVDRPVPLLASEEALIVDEATVASWVPRPPEVTP